MLLRWLPNNQLKLETTEMYAQYSQFINKLFVLTDVFDLQTAMTASFSRYNQVTKKWEQIEDESAGLICRREDNGYMFECYIPPSVFENQGQVGVSLSATVATPYKDMDGETVYQNFTSGVVKFYVDPSIKNLGAKVPGGDATEILLSLQRIESEAVLIEKTTAKAITLDEGAEATAQVVKETNDRGELTGYMQFLIGIPRGTDGKDGVDGSSISSIEKVETNGLVDTYAITLTNGIVQTFTVTNGSKGEKGDAGTFAISKVYASVDAMNAGFATDGLPIGALVVIEKGNVDDPDNAKLYVKEANGYQFLTDMSGAKGIQGPAGNGIANIQQTTNNTGSGEPNTVVMTLDNGASRSFTVYNGQAGTNGTKIFVGLFDNPNEHPQVVEGAVVGDLYIGIDGGLWDYTGQTNGWLRDTDLKGARGQQGEEGVGITNIQKVASVGLRDEYRISLSNGNTYTFYVTNGKDGTDGTNGTDGVSIVSVTKTATNGLVDTYTITLSNGNTSTFDVTNGKDGVNGTNGKDGTNGTNGKDGVSIVSASLVKLGTNGND